MWLAGGTKAVTTSLERRREARAKSRARIRQRVSQMIEDAAPDLTAGSSGAGLSSAQLRQILDALREDGNKRRLDATKQQLRSLASQLRALQRVTGGSVALPAIPVVIRRKASPFKSDRFASLLLLRRLMDKFLKDLPNGQKSAIRMAGQIIFSSIVFGGLINPRLVKALPKAIEDGIRAHDGLLWLDVEFVDRRKVEKLRRWFPDPISQCLILRWRAQGLEWPQTSAENLIWKLMRALDRQIGTTALTLPKLIRANTTRLREELPALLVDFLASPTHGQSLPPRAWWRVLCDYHLATPRLDHYDASGLAPPDGASSERSVFGDAADDLSELTALKRLLRNPADGRSVGPTAALRGINALRSTTLGGAMVRHLMDWSVWMIKGGSGTRCKPSSVNRYLNAFGRPLIALAGELDPHTEPVDELGEKYVEVLRAINIDGQRPMASIGLRHFHTYLMLACDLQAVEIDGVTTTDQHVRANTVSEAELSRILSAIKSSSLPERDISMLTLMTTLLYRLGLRRNELAWLRVEDIQADEHGVRPLLWVHGHPSSSLKTHSSKRRLALAHLMPRGDIKRLVAWRDRRITELGRVSPRTALLFCDRGADTTRLDDKFIDRIVAVARQASGDETIVLHTFRHAFASNLFAGIMHAGWLAAHGRSALVKSDRRLPWRTYDTQTRVLQTSFLSDRLPRGAAYLLSIHAGHLDPTETMRTYVHHQDFIAYLYLHKMTREYPNRLWAALEGISEEALKVRHSRHKKRSGVAVVAYHETALRLLRAAKIPAPPGEFSKADPVVDAILSIDDGAPKDAFTGMRLDAIYSALSTLIYNMTHQARTVATGLDAKTLGALVSSARLLADVATNTRNRNARRRRHLIPRPPRQRPSMATRPQLDNIGPALPKRSGELREARTAFDRALASHPHAMLDRLLDLLQRTSLSDPVITFETLEDLNAGIESLRLLGITLKQIRVVVRALPAGQVTATKWRATVEKALEVRLPVAVNERPQGVSRSKTSNPAGRIAVEVITAGRRSSGWRIGSYYAACVLAVRSGTDPHQLSIVT